MIVQTDGVCGGRARIDGTRICCETIGVMARLGWTVTDFQKDYPQLTAEQIEAAIEHDSKRIAELEKRTPSLDEISSVSVLGPQKQPASVAQIEAQTKAVRRELGE